VVQQELQVEQLIKVLVVEVQILMVLLMMLEVEEVVLLLLV
jgi:hypothetical protein